MQGYAVNYEVQPAFTIPSPGEPASMVTLGPVLEGLANAIPWLNRRCGTERVIRRVTFDLGTTTTPFISNPWASSTPSAPSSSWQQFAGASFSLAEAWQSGDHFEFYVSLSSIADIAGAPLGSSHYCIGAAFSNMPGPGVYDHVFSAECGQYVGGGVSISLAHPVTLTGDVLAPNTAGIGATWGLYFRTDSFSVGGTTINIQLLGGCAGVITHWRQN